MARPKLKSITTTIKLTPEVRAAWQAAAVQERRTLTNMLEVLVLDWCRRHKIEVPAVIAPIQTDRPCRQGRKDV